MTLALEPSPNQTPSQRPPRQPCPASSPGMGMEGKLGSVPSEIGLSAMTYCSLRSLVSSDGQLEMSVNVLMETQTKSFLNFIPIIMETVDSGGTNWWLLKVFPNTSDVGTFSILTVVRKSCMYNACAQMHLHVRIICLNCVYAYNHLTSYFHMPAFVRTALVLTNDMLCSNCRESAL